MNERAKTIRFILVLGLVFIGAFWAAWSTPSGRDILKHVTGFFGVLVTPFFLEATLFFIGALILFAWLHHQNSKEGDGWVYLAETQADPLDPLAPEGESRTRSAIFLKKPEAFDPESLDLATWEGYLDLGLESDAAPLLDFHPSPAHQTRWSLLVFRYYLQTKQWDKARSTQEQLLARANDVPPLLLSAAEESGKLWKERGQNDHARTCETWRV